MMNVFITLDYELFFGDSPGTVRKCIIEPTQELLKITEPLGVKFNIFADAGYLYKLQISMKDYPNLQSDYELISNQLHYLASTGHSVDLHIHPHWEDSYYDGSQWIMDTKRYKLGDFSKEEASEIVIKYNRALTEASGIATRAYRAGGWSCQPFSHISNSLKEVGVYIDSTVFPKGYYHSEHQCFDFRNVKPYAKSYNFEDDLTLSEPNGEFLEVPISSVKVNPIFFWKFVLRKLLKNEEDLSMGDGRAVSLTKKEVLRLLTRSSYSVVSMDGFKASLLEAAFNKYIKRTSNRGEFVIIGHPKAFTPFSLGKTKFFIEKALKEGHIFSTYRDYK